MFTAYIEKSYYMGDFPPVLHIIFGAISQFRILKVYYFTGLLIIS